jgi:hypothetical protein
MHFKFKSLRHKEQGYAYDTGSFDMKAPMFDHFRVFQTYGDGLTQHSHDWSVTFEYLADYLASLAVAMTGNEELTDAVKFHIARRPNNREIEFAAGIHYNEKKRQYYSVKELKVSSSDSKRHDKRYFEITEVNNGSPNAIFRVLVPEDSMGLEKYIYASAIRDWLHENDRGYMQLPTEFLNWSHDRAVAQDLHNAYEACWHLVQSNQYQHTAKGHLDNYKRAHQIEEPVPAPEAAD